MMQVDKTVFGSVRLSYTYEIDNSVHPVGVPMDELLRQRSSWAAWSCMDPVGMLTDKLPSQRCLEPHQPTVASTSSCTQANGKVHHTPNHSRVGLSVCMPVCGRSLRWWHLLLCKQHLTGSYFASMPLWILHIDLKPQKRHYESYLTRSMNLRCCCVWLF